MTENYPETPAEIAQAVLEGIEQAPDCFDMDNWIYRNPGRFDMDSYPPSANPWEDGTVMCAASWVAHVTGWTIQFGVPGMCSKGDQVGFVSMVARQALGLHHSDDFWFTENDVALLRLTEIAHRT